MELLESQKLHIERLEKQIVVLTNKQNDNVKDDNAVKNDANNTNKNDNENNNDNMELKEKLQSCEERIQVRRKMQMQGLTISKRNLRKLRET